MVTTKNNLFYEIQLKDPAMESIMSEAIHMVHSEYVLQNSKTLRCDARTFLKKYAGFSVSEISWKCLCDDSSFTKLNRFRIALLIVLMDKGLYVRHDKDDIARLIPIFKAYLPVLKTEWIQFFCIDDAPDVYYKEKRAGLSVYRIPHYTGYLRQCIIDFLDSSYEEKYRVQYLQIFCNTFAESFPIKITDYTQHTAGVFWKQVEYYKALQPESLVYVKILIHFYRMLFKKYTDYEFFVESDHICMSVLRDDRFINFLQKEYVSEDRTYVFKTGTSKNTYEFLTSFPYKKTVLIDLVVSYQKSRADVQIFQDTSDFLYNFEDSLGRYRVTVNVYADFNENTFWEQILYYQKKYRTEKTNRYNAISFVCFFYRYLVNTYEEHAYFADSFTMTKYLLFNQQLTGRILNGYKFVYYNPYGEAPDAERIMFTLRGLDQYSTNIASEDYFSIDLTPIAERKYRKLLMQYMQSSINVLIELHGHHCSTFKEVLPKIVKIKAQTNYPNNDLYYFTNQEAVLIRNFIYKEDSSLGTLNNKIGSMRRFFKWAQETGNMQFDDMFFDYLKQYEEPPVTSAHPVSDNDLIALNGLLVKKAHDNHLYLLTYTVFHLLIQTEFRISQICKLKINCIKPSVKLGQYRVVAGSKTSHGAKDSYVITNLTYHLLMNAIDATEIYREKCNIETYKDYIFLYDGSMNAVISFTNDIFSSCMETCCKELNLDTSYSASNLRDTHMTKAFEHVLRTGKSDMEMSILSKHRHLDTTKSHYIDIELEKMLEATYGITIGEKYVDTKFKVVDEVPESAQGTESDVQEGCGKCTSSECVFASLLPCMVCKFFITTEGHEIFFTKAIEHIDKLIMKTINKHDLEDLTLTKTLYVLYLEAIYKHKEGISLL
jgi:integrase